MYVIHDNYEILCMNYLSIIDVLMNHGKETKQIINQYELI